ncbi:flavoprotein oxidoreductase [Streptomyces avermitilis]|uniref:Flavoprotein oxidoreductase n=1 Tax=Streptomyces avermitilis (strain ATCC 31267 / DSM 46492 / JCM 5070 / NBRC 14893 / NCIMB 12804 / NRRL 8165 / MA-4680) TaxID=227882 RepID=Q82KY7_STRAW|nr:MULTISPECIES: FAD-dependent oxidoreductase [Streptomyces]KUN50830.1 flavoprotein oxidoreductase [Streptomyces avermitilis]MYS97840.1 FAD-dependent oxidoreductase [Streptomyces sp. SID5469]OOV24237.1 flavoprotein oxidoreductase [Streptomyces avermitilis]BAC69936.1 putative flavoprotein oxidoreductase [Streptomyces avermitilis MA-4680 = NBRC 14893]
MSMSRTSRTKERLVVIGGDAAGMSAASQARRLKGPAELEIVAFERGHFTSYSACGIPYWVGGDVAERDQLIARTPEEHRARGIGLRIRTEVTEIDAEGARVRSRDLASGAESWTSYDKLVIATGARPVRPELPGVDAPGVHGVQTLDDGQALLDTLAATRGRRAVVVGAGYIGVEMAEALINRGYEVTVVNRSKEPMATLDPDMGRLVHKAMEGLGITMVNDAEVTGLPTGDDGRVRAVATEDAEYPADVVVLGIGVRPETTLAQAAGLPLGEHHGLLTDLAMRVRGHENIWAGGDCVEVLDLVSGSERHIPLGTHANKHGQVIGANVGGGYATFPGVVGTAVSKVCDLEIARTGLREKDARRAGLQFEAVTVESTSRAGYYPGADPMTVKMLAERRTGRLLGVQIVGGEGAGKRVDIAAVALTAGMTVEQMTALDLGYAPPFSPVWDPILVAARKAVAAVRANGV